MDGSAGIDVSPMTGATPEPRQPARREILKRETTTRPEVVSHRFTAAVVRELPSRQDTHVFDSTW
jgi:hypothetical protein